MTDPLIWLILEITELHSSFHDNTLVIMKYNHDFNQHHLGNMPPSQFRNYGKINEILRENQKIYKGGGPR